MKNLIFIPLLLLVGCMQKKSDPAPTYVTCTIADETAGGCLRYMDRTIKLAINNASTPNKNSIFDLETLQDIIEEISVNTILGSSYFQFSYVDQSALATPSEEAEGFSSNIQIWEDAEFNALYANMLTINSGAVADPNAIVVTNYNNRRQFYIVFRRSCFSGDSSSCTGDNSISISPSLGVKALVARTLSRLISTRVKSSTYCAITPSNYLCSVPTDGQWSIAEQNRAYSTLNSALELISLNSSSYYKTNPVVP